MTRTALSLAAILSTGMIANGQVVISDDYTAVNSGSGFGAGSGVNSGINPPATRLTGTDSAGLSYYLSGGTRADSFFTINNNQLRVGANNTIARFTFTNDGTTAHDFGASLGTSLATAVSPLSYDVKISMANHENGTQRMSFGIGTAEGDATTWDFGVQLYQSGATSTQNQIQKRIDTASSGLAADVNATMLTQGAGTFGNQVDFLLRITDAGAESGTEFNSRVQVSLDGGATFVYDTDADSAVANHFRFDGAGRYFLFDIAGGAGVTGNVTYDDLSVNVITPVPEPSTLALFTLGGVGMFWYFRRRTA